MTFTNKSGFSLLEIMVALGVAGIVSLSSLSIFKNLQKSSKTSDITLEVNTVTNSITQTLLNAEACVNTFKNVGPLRENLEISEIKNTFNNTIFNKTSKYGNNRLKISKLTLTDVNLKPAQAGSDKKYGEFTLDIVLEKIGKELSGKKYSSKSLPFYAEFDLGGNLLDCYTATEDTALTAGKIFCEQIGGSWVATTKICNLSTQIGNYIALSTEEMEARFNDLINNIIPANYTKKAGDTMTGSLTIIGANLNAVDVLAGRNQIATISVCVGTRCRDFNLKQCNKDSLQVGINPDGSPICTPLTCADGYYFERFDSNTGIPFCRQLPNKTCAANEFVSEVLPNGTVKCEPLPDEDDRRCPRGQYVKTIDPDGEITCENPNINLNCAGNQYVYGFNNLGLALCKLMP